MGEFNSGGVSPRSVVAADFDNNGLIDLAAANYNSGSVGVLLNRGSLVSPYFPNVSTFLTEGTGPSNLTFGDFNSDGNIDLAVANRSSHRAAIEQPQKPNSYGGLSREQYPLHRHRPRAPQLWRSLIRVRNTALGSTADGRTISRPDVAFKASSSPSNARKSRIGVLSRVAH